ncbi:MAG TPA: hypothetical protein VK171_00915 [Fimbriimonas sp.]|nr:hypothetical protein [Fimbriimonas sp.]
MANPKPIFLAKSVKVEALRSMGADGTHARMTLSNPQHRFIQGVAFNQYEFLSGLAGQTVDVVFDPQINEYQGSRTIQWRVLDVRQPT